MPITTLYDAEHQLCEIRLDGVLLHDDFTAHQAQMAQRIEAGDQPLVLVIVGDFKGWEKAGEWQNLDFMFGHGARIRKIAFVGDKRWEDQLKMFVGAGFRDAPVGYFESDKEDIARAWLLG